MSGELTKWNTLKSIVITQKEDLPKVKPNLAVADAAIKILKSRGDFKQLFEISEWQANLKRQAGRFVEGMEKGIPGPKKIGDIVSPNYKDHGFTRQDARRWRLHAIIPESELEAYFATAEYEEEEYSITGLMVFAGEWYGRNPIAVAEIIKEANVPEKIIGNSKIVLASGRHTVYFLIVGG
jgi:hypothetical protein